MKIKFATSIRGFFKHLLTEKELLADIEGQPNKLYEVHKTSRKIRNRIGKMRIFDTLGYIHAPKISNGNCDMYASFNRFLRADKPYFIYVENPTGLYHYKLERRDSYLGQKRIRTLINDPNLKALVCMSKACQNTFEAVCHVVPVTCKLVQIYPLVPSNPSVSTSLIIERCSITRPIRLLYIAQGNAFLSKGILEISDALDYLRKNISSDITLTVVTSLNDADSETLSQIRRQDGVTVYDFNFSFNEMQDLYASHTVLLVPTSHDSFNLTVLEAMKAGLPIIGTNLYAIPEMVTDGYNGYLTDPAWWFFDKNNMPNAEVWNNRENTIFSKTKCKRITDFIIEKVSTLYFNRTLLSEMSLNSYKKSMSIPFNYEYIVSQWNSLFAEFEESV